MKLISVVTYDTITGEATTAPQLHKNENDAKRSWGMAVNQLSKDPTNKTPIKDYQLYKIGEFDTETLEFTPDKRFLANAGEFLEV